MRAEIISIGTEILMGEILDTNAQYVAQRLPAMGIDLFYMHQIGDNRRRLVELITQARGRSDVVLCTGGLGPTEDDITREAIAESIGEEPHVVPELEAHLRNFFESRGGQMPEQNVKQATIVPSGESIPNPRGTAPGWWVEKDGAIIIAMPGPPAEMTGMWSNDVGPRLAARSDGTVLISRTLKTTGLGESTLDEALGDIRAGEDPTVGVYHKADGVHVRLASKALDEATARARIEPVEAAIRALLGDNIWGADEDTFQEAVARLLDSRGLSIAVMESCTGGLLASTITDVPGASRFFRGGLVTYTAEAKIHYGVDSDVIEAHGVVSNETASAMAAAVRKQFDADIGVGITGVAGPEPHGGQPVGAVCLGVEAPEESYATGYTFAQTRAAIKARAVTSALTLIRRAALGELSTGSSGIYRRF